MKFPLTKLIYFIFAFLTISSCSLFDKDDETTKDGPEVGFFPVKISYFRPNESTVNYSFDFFYDDANKLHAIDQSDATGFEGDNVLFTYNNLGQIIKTLLRGYAMNDDSKDRITNFVYENNKMVSIEEISPYGPTRNYNVDFNESTKIFKATSVQNPDFNYTLNFDQDFNFKSDGYFTEINYANGKGVFHYLDRKINFFLLANPFNYYFFASKQISQVKINSEGVEMIMNFENKTDSNGMVSEYELKSGSTNVSLGKFKVEYQERFLNP